MQISFTPQELNTFVGMVIFQAEQHPFIKPDKDSKFEHWQLYLAWQTNVMLKALADCGLGPYVPYQ